MYNKGGDTMIKHPIPKKTYQKRNNKSNMGMTLEADIEATNTYYLDMNIAVIYKKPTPIQVVTVNYPARSKAKITEAYYKTPSTTDFNGIYEGRYIDFDVKETASKTSIPLSNIHPHQVEHLRSVKNHGGIAFLIVHWKYYDEHYFLPCEVLFEYYDQQKKGGRKSIPYQAFQEKAYLIPFSLNPRLDYLSIIQSLYLK